MLASRASIWPRDSLWRSTTALRSLRPMRWRTFLPMSMPSVATAAVVWRGMGLLVAQGSPRSKRRWGARPTIPLG
jgi:hypothetical protein